MQKKKSSTRVWMLVPTKKDLVILVERLAAMGPLWDRWECKLRSDRILIYDPVVPWDERDNLAASTPQLQKILRIVPVQGGPFERCPAKFRHNSSSTA